MELLAGAALRRGDSATLSQMVGLAGAVVVCTPQQVALFVAQVAIGIRRRHLLIRILGQDALDQFAIVGLPRNDRFFRPLPIERVEPQLALALAGILAVAVEAVLRKDRTNVATVVDRSTDGGGLERSGQRS